MNPVKDEPSASEANLVSVGVMNNQRSLNPIIIIINIKQTPETVHPFVFEFDWID